MVSVWATENGLTLGQSLVAEKSNEITAVPALLRQLELAGCIVTADALHCQKETAREIIEADADYVLALKGNQGTAHEEIKAYLDDAVARQAPQLSTKPSHPQTSRVPVSDSFRSVRRSGGLHGRLGEPHSVYRADREVTRHGLLRWFPAPAARPRLRPLRLSPPPRPPVRPRP